MSGGGHSHSLSVRGKCYWKISSMHTYSICVCLYTRNTGKVMFLWGRKCINRDCVFRPLSIRSCLNSKMWDLQFCAEDLIPRAREMCFHALSKPWKHISHILGLSMGNRLQECVWWCLMSYCAYLDEVMLWWKLASSWSGEQPDCFRNSKGWIKAITVKGKKTAIGCIFK